jgi:hypothetical protein
MPNIAPSRWSIPPQSSTGHADYQPLLLPIDATTRVALGSLTANHRNYPGVSIYSVPFSAPHHALLSVSFGEIAWLFKKNLSTFEIWRGHSQ